MFPIRAGYLFKCRRGLAHCRACSRFGSGGCVGIICQRKTPSRPRRVFWEVALSAELRQVPQAETRLKEAAKLGFEQGFMPEFSKKIRPPSGISTPSQIIYPTLSTYYPGAGHEEKISAYKPAYAISVIKTLTVWLLSGLFGNKDNARI